MKTKLKAFNFTAESKRDSFGLDFAPLLDLCIIVALFFWLGSRFTFSPGITVDLPQSDHKLQGIPCTAVLTVARTGSLLFQGGRYRLDEVGLELQKLTDRVEGPVSLLVKIDKSYSMTTFLKLCEIARESGIQFVQIASGSTHSENP
ncbi:MAG: biopolymer transporter ExbD [Opitutales bacterium]